MKAQGKFTDRHDEVLGEIYLNLNQLADARPYLKRGIENHPDSSNAFVNYSALLANEGKIQEAILLLESNRPRFQDADYLIQLGRLLDRAGQVQKEVDVFQSVVHDYPQDPRGFFYLGKIVLEHHGNPQAVIQLAEKGLSLKPDSEFLPFGYFLLADAYTALGDRNKAQQYLKIAQKSD
jgi:tetratricopeptide (TPR) repeat protein